MDYNITVKECVNDVVTANIGDEILLTIVPDEGYRLDSNALQVNGQEIEGETFIMMATDVEMTTQFVPIDIPNSQKPGSSRSKDPKHRNLKTMSQGSEDPKLENQITNVPKVEHINSQGADPSFQLGNKKDLTFVVSGRSTKLKQVIVDGKILDHKYYTADFDHNTITLKADYLQGLKEGEHNLEIVFTDGVVKASFSVLDTKA